MSDMRIPVVPLNGTNKRNDNQNEEKNESGDPYD